MRYYGIDYSLRSSGVVELRDDKEGYSSKLIVTKDTMRGIKRARFIAESISDLIHPNEVAVIVLEGYAFASKSSSKTDIAEGTGILKDRLLNITSNIYVFAPSSLKKFITGNGKCQKDLIMKEVLKRWKVDIDSTDLADAYGLAMAGKLLFDNATDIPKFQVEALAKLRESRIVF